MTPGGLDPGGPDEGSLIVNSSQGGGSKDTWIVDAALADHEDPGGDRDNSAPDPAEAAEVTHRPDGFRVAEAEGPVADRWDTVGGRGRREGRCCWHGWRRPSTGRGVTWSEPRTWPGSCRSTARPTSTCPSGRTSGWGPLIEIAGTAAFRSSAGAAGRPAAARRSSEGPVVEIRAGRPGQPLSILSSISAARTNFRVARPVVPREVWELCNELWLARVWMPAASGNRDGRVRWLRRVVDGVRG